MNKKIASKAYRMANVMIRRTRSGEDAEKKLLRLLRKMQVISLRAMREPTADYCNYTLQKIDEIRRIINNAYQEYRQKVNSDIFKNIMLDLIALAESYPLNSPGPVFQPNLKDKCLEFTTLPITFKTPRGRDVPLGTFTIKIYGSADPYDTSIRVVANKPLYAKGSRTVTHPNVSDNRLCPGEGADAISRAIRDRRYLDIFTIINTILNSGTTSPYIPISHWYGKPCWICKTDPDTGVDIQVCSACGQSVCAQCRTSCPKCGTTYCTICAPKYVCSVCGERMCKCTSTVRCGKCRRWIHTPCAKRCAKCGIFLCNYCAIVCEKCGKTFCRSHALGCTECGRTFCRNEDNGGCYGYSTTCAVCEETLAAAEKNGELSITN